MRSFFLSAAMTGVLLLHCIPVFANPTGAVSNPANNTVQTMAAEVKPAPEQVIKFGDRGSSVLRVQKLLSDIGLYAEELDGIFGWATLQAVKDFQAINLLPVDGVVNKETVAFLERANIEPSRHSRSLTVTATAYTAYDDGCGNTTYRGHTLRKGLVAVDPHVIPLGTRMYISGYGYAIADDIGGAIKGNRIDLAFESRQEAFQFGVQRVTVYIMD